MNDVFEKFRQETGWKQVRRVGHPVLRGKSWTEKHPTAGRANIQHQALTGKENRNKMWKNIELESKMVDLSPWQQKTCKH